MVDGVIDEIFNEICNVAFRKVKWLQILININEYRGGRQCGRNAVFNEVFADVFNRVYNEVFNKDFNEVFSEVKPCTMAELVEHWSCVREIVGSNAWSNQTNDF